MQNTNETTQAKTTPMHPGPVVLVGQPVPLGLPVLPGPLDQPVQPGLLDQLDQPGLKRIKRMRD